MHPTLTNPNHSNASFVFRLRPDIDVRVLQEALQDLWATQPALRARFSQGRTGWRQSFVDASAPVPFRRIELGSTPPDQRDEIVETAIREFDRTLDLSRGPLARFVLFHLGPDEPPRLVAFAHHLVTDAVSTNILGRQMAAAYRRSQAGQRPLAHDGPAPYRECIERLHEYARSSAMDAELEYWVTRPWAELAPLPERCPSEPASEVYPVRQRQATVPRPSRPHVKHLVLTAAADVLTSWLGGPVAAWVIHNGRTLARRDSDGHDRPLLPVAAMQTMGLFAYNSIAFLPHRAGGCDLDYLGDVQKSLAEPPNGGTGYELLKWLRAAESLHERVAGAGLEPELTFNYIPDLVPRAGSIFALEHRTPMTVDYFAPQPRMKVRVAERGEELALALAWDSRIANADAMPAVFDAFRDAVTRYCNTG